MKIAYLDLIGGASGDMILGALVDSGVSIEALKDSLAGLHLDGFDLRAGRVSKHGFAATKVDVVIRDHASERHLRDILAILESADLPEKVITRAMQIVHRLGEVEAGIHQAPIDRVHLHELGGLDTIVDITGSILGFEMLAVERIVVSPVPLGRGFIQGAHGQIPLPAPATLALLKEAPITGSPIDAELVTPTGAALLSGLASAFGPIPPMHLERIGYGAGGRDLPIPNLLRLMVGETNANQALISEHLVSLETNIDDLNPETYAHAIERLFEAGALDVTLTPIQMKKNRPATKLWALCRPQNVEAITGIIFMETGTLGVRKSILERVSLPREKAQVETEYGVILGKISRWQGVTRFSPEYEDCRRVAREQQAPLWQVYQAAQRASEEHGFEP